MSVIRSRGRQPPWLIGAQAPGAREMAGGKEPERGKGGCPRLLPARLGADLQGSLGEEEGQSKEEGAVGWGLCDWGHIAIPLWASY